MAKRHIFYSYCKKETNNKTCSERKKTVLRVLYIEVYDYSFFIHAYRYHMLRHQVQ